MHILINLALAISIVFNVLLVISGYRINSTKSGSFDIKSIKMMIEGRTLSFIQFFQELMMSMRDVQTGIENNATRIEAIKQRIEMLQSKSGEFKALQDQNNVLIQENATLKAQAEATAANQGNVQAIIDAANANAANLQSQVDAANAAAQGAQQAISDAQAALAAAQAEKQALQAQIDSQAGDIAALEASLVRQNETIDQLKAALDALETGATA